MESLVHASIPDGLEVTLVPVNNNSTDDTAGVIRELQAKNPQRAIRYIFEPRKGSSAARNAGIRSGASDLVAFIDDDERVEEHYFQIVAREFRDSATEFLGGPYLGDWAAPKPRWLPPGFHAVIGALPINPRSVMDADFPGILMGGNAVLRRSVFDRVGLYDENLGRFGSSPTTEEDAEFYRRLLAHNIRGLYTPDLIIYHLIPAERLIRKYHRRWCFWRGVSQGIYDRRQQEPVAYLFGVPRYRFGWALKPILHLPRILLSQGRLGKLFAGELHSWGLAGFIYGKHFASIDRLSRSQ